MTITRTTLPDGRIDATCETCGMAIVAPVTFGGIPQGVLVAEFEKLHRHEGKHDERRYP